MPYEIDGLTSKEAKRRLDRYGPNILPEKPPPSALSVYLSQFTNPLVYVLLAAGFITLFLRDYADTAIIFFVVFVNSILGYFQEQKASHALESLKAMIHPTALVFRDGKQKRIKVTEVVPEDIVKLQLGDKIPADGKLIDANRLLVDEAVLTGESLPVEKKEGDKAFMGTVVSGGEALLKVELTGASTEMGKIASSVQKKEEDTPLTKQLKIFSNQLTILVIALTAFVFLIGYLTGKDMVEIFETSVALAVSSIPEGLLIAITVVLAVGMQRILKKKGLVRKLVSAETLGGVTTICVDKTGTLTYGKLTMSSKIGDIENICLQHFASSDDPIMVAAGEWLEKNSMHYEDIGKVYKKSCTVIDTIPFTPENRYYATLIEHKDREKDVYVNGAPETVLAWSKLSAAEKKKVKKRIRSLTKEGKRIVAMAMMKTPEKATKIDEKSLKKGLIWVGLLAFSDPVREGVKNAFTQTKKAGIKTIVITGDYAETAMAVMKELEIGINENRVIIGSDLEKMDTNSVAKKLSELFKESSNPILFARTRPQQKLKVIDALKRNSETVAMMGDGVNDAPALHKADIGIVVGEATDVAKESADLVLLDSSFETIVAAIREGRGIFDNIRKIILYLLSDSFEEIVAVVGTLIFNLPLPVTAVQILWINIISDGFPHLSLAVDPKEKGIMDRPPRPPGSNIVARWMKLLILIVSLAGGAGAFLLFVIFYRYSGSQELARSIAFATLGINSLLYVFSIRILHKPFWRENPFANKWLNLAVIAGMVLQIFPFLFPFTRDFFGLAKLNLYHWLVIFMASFVMFIIIETCKEVFTLKSKS